MKVKRTGGVASLIVVGTVALAACGSDNNAGTTSSGTSGGTSASPAAQVACASGALTGAGSSFQAPIQQQWVKDYSAKCAGTQINYQSVGSGAGVQQFTSGTVDFAGSDVALKPDEQTKADARCAAGPAVHLSPATVAGIFAGTIKTWDAPGIKADNPNAKLPATPVTAFHRSDGSGTTQVVSEFLDSQAKGAWNLGSGKEINWPGGQGAKGSEGVTAGVKQTDGGIAYSEVSFAKANSLSVAKVRNASGQYAELNAANVSKALESFTVTGSATDVKGTVNYGVSSGYPISTVTYVIGCGKGGKNTPLLKSYLTYAVTGGQAVADSLGFAPLPTAIADKNKAAITAIG